ncbi:MAG TPA: hypothetical protein VMW31_00495 [Devosiaceae bacterium]|nr:hypothetical protein [Devosiaceae bacterium]
MFYDPASPVLSGGGPAAVIGWDDCGSRLDVGESIRLSADNGDFLEVGASINIVGVSGTPGSSISINAGDGTNPSGGGGNIINQAGVGFDGNSGGSVSVFAGNHTDNLGGGGGGGAISIRAGNSDDPGLGGGDAGSIILQAGNKIGTPGNGGDAGDVEIFAGSGSSGDAGNINIEAGPHTATSGGTVDISGGVGPTSTGAVSLHSGAEQLSVRHSGGLPGVAVLTAATERVRWSLLGEWIVGGSAGIAGQIVTSQGAGLPAIWAGIGATPILGADGSCAAPTYSFASSPDSGMFYDPAGVGSVVIGDDTCADFISVGASIRAVTAIGDRVDIGASPSSGVAITAGSNGWVSINYDVGGATQLTVPIAQIVRIFGAHSSTAATLGGEVRVTAGNSGAGSAAGAGVNITGGIVTGSATALGANIQIGGGQPAVQGGALTLSGGNSTGALQPAGPAMLRGGSGTSSNGGDAEVQSGVNAAAGTGGHLYLTLGGRAAATAMGDLHIRTRDAGSVYADLYTIIGNTGEFQIAGTAGVAGQAFTSNGPGLSPSWQTPAGVAEPITQMVYGTGPAVDSSPFFFWNVATGQLNLNINAGATPLSYAGGGGTDVTIRGSDRTAARGSDVYVLGGNGLTGFNDGGNVTIEGGKTDAPGRFAGNLFLKGGSPLGGGTTATGGRVELQSGDGHGSTDAQAGSVQIFMGDPGSGVSNQTSAIQITRIVGQGGGLYIPGSNNSPVTLLGNDARYAAAPQGQNVTIQSGSGGTGTVVNAPSGNVILSINTPHGTGAVGVIKFEGARNPVSTAVLPLGYVTAKGDWVLAGFGNGTNGGEHTPIPAAAITGFAWLPRVAAAPTGVPAGTEVPGGTGYAFPMCVEPSGATLVLWAYDFPNAAWRSVVLS